jgi:hypothetical protein
MRKNTVDMGQLLQITQNTAMSVSAQSKQMGLILSTVEDLRQDMDGMRNDLETLKRETTITRPMCRQIRKAVMRRVNELLEIEFDGGKVADGSIQTDVLYRGGFISRCYTDAKNHSKMGESYSETLKVDFDEVMKYIEAWVPEVGDGTEGYKRYLDIRREERKKRSGEVA